MITIRKHFPSSSKQKAFARSMTTLIQNAPFMNFDHRSVEISRAIHRIFKV